MARTSMDCFRKAVELLSLPAEFVEIPYEGTKLPGWFWRSPVAGPKAPVLIVHQGRDAWAEDNKFIADAAMQRGYHVLMVHAPGQGMALRELGLPFRPDWEKVITPVIDFALQIPGSIQTALRSWVSVWGADSRFGPPRSTSASRPSS